MSGPNGGGGGGVPLIQGNTIDTWVNGVKITHYADPRAAHDQDSRLISCIMVWCRGLEVRLQQAERQLAADRDIIRAVAERAGVTAEDLNDIVAQVAAAHFEPEPSSPDADP